MVYIQYIKTELRIHNHLDADPDPAHHQSDLYKYATPVVLTLTTTFWASIPPLWTSMALHGSILNLYSSKILTSMRIRIFLYFLCGSGSQNDVHRYLWGLDPVPMFFEYVAGGVHFMKVLAVDCRKKKGKPFTFGVMA